MQLKVQSSHGVMVVNTTQLTERKMTATCLECHETKSSRVDQ